jgi:hypothetical protein
MGLCVVPAQPRGGRTVNTLHVKESYVGQKPAAQNDALDALYSHLAAVRQYRAHRLVQIGLPQSLIVRELGPEPGSIPPLRWWGTPSR